MRKARGTRTQAAKGLQLRPGARATGRLRGRLTGVELGEGGHGEEREREKLTSPRRNEPGRPCDGRRVSPAQKSEVDERQAPRFWFWTIPGAGAPILEEVLSFPLATESQAFKPSP